MCVTKVCILLSFDPSLMTIMTGTVALDDETNGVRRSVSRAVIHPAYNGSSLPEGDVALLQVINSKYFQFFFKKK